MNGDKRVFSTLTFKSAHLSEIDTSRANFVPILASKSIHLLAILTRSNLCWA